MRYSIAGQGRAVLVPKKDRHGYLAATGLAERYRVLQVEPIGFGQSDRPDLYPSFSVPEQILAVCDAEGVEEFAVWGTHKVARWPALWRKRLRGPSCGVWRLQRPASADCCADRDHES